MGKSSIISFRISWSVYLLLSCAAALLLLAGCGSSTTNTVAQLTPTAQATLSTPTIIVSITEKVRSGGDVYALEPANIAVLPGTTVIWNNTSDEAQSLSSNKPGVFTATQKVTKAASLKITFTGEGMFAYFLKNHPDVKGMVTVQKSSKVAVEFLQHGESNQQQAYMLTPGGLVIKSGTTVMWENKTDQEHVLTADKVDVFDSTSDLKKEGSYQKIFSKPGTYIYYSKNHPDLKGTIVVVP